ncbi:GNAT family N-acetyltransferase [Stieleria tagensis]|uniref:GNAT family N-acetyltransferase n=1 Tax=Stieleria tagensis TaxID=2956795 RepID=UPI00209B02E3|nr:GNAT family N-acetyltransferase [Stieleria tagensis]
MLDPRAFCRNGGPPGFEVEPVAPPDEKLNRSFYRAVGAQWQWTDRLGWSDADWHQYVHRDELKTWIGRLDGQPAGYFELESQCDGNLEIVYFGLLPDFIGRGLGGPLLSAAIACAWDVPGTWRVWVHTCSEDHQNALENYRKRGFEIFKTERVQKFIRSPSVD